MRPRHVQEDVSLTYSDDPVLRRSGLLGRWLDRRSMMAAQERALAWAAADSGNGMPDRNPKAKLPGDPFALRGIPVVGVHGGAGGAMRDTRPGERLLRDSASRVE